MSLESSLSRIPWLASSLSMICPGLGQIYCGRAGRGLIILGLASFFGPLIVGLSSIATSTLSLILLAVCVLFSFGLSVWSAVDAKRIAISLKGRTYALQDYNRLAVYLLLPMTSIPCAIGLALFLRSNVLEAFSIPTSSMAPTLIPGDRILANKLGLSTRTFQRGEVIVFRNPENRRQMFVKRIVGLPGDNVEVTGRELLINGELYHRLSETATPSRPPRLTKEAVPAGSYFVVGDNLDLSHDSRNFGLLSHGEITGVVTYLYWPAQSWSRLGSVK